MRRIAVWIRRAPLRAVGFAIATGATALLLMASACGGAQQTSAGPEQPTSDESASEPAAEASPPETGAASSDADLGDQESAEASSAELAEPADDDPNRTREVVYKMSPGTLEIEVDGIKFVTKAEPVKVHGGAWGVKIKMQAEAVGDDTRYLLKPKGGVLAFAGTIKRKGKTEDFGDRREGSESIQLAPGDTIDLESTWPKDKSETALWWGNELLLESGLWGIGPAPGSLRPVKQFFTLRMVAGNKPQPILQPPKSAQ